MTEKIFLKDLKNIVKLSHFCLKIYIYVLMRRLFLSLIFIYVFIFDNFFMDMLRFDFRIIDSNVWFLKSRIVWSRLSFFRFSV